MIITDMKLFDIKSLHPHEEIDPLQLNLLSKKINKEGKWIIPIIIDRETHIIMDGHHRYSFAQKSGFSLIPCYEMSYSSEGVQVFDWKTGAPFSYQKIVEIVKYGKTFPSKTTRHYFKEKFETVEVNLNQLY